MSYIKFLLFNYDPFYYFLELSYEIHQNLCKVFFVS